METTDVFISYSNDDITWAKWLCGVLEINGLSCCISEHTDYDIADTMEKIEAARVFVLICTKKMKESDFASKETDRAFNLKKTMFPVTVSDNLLRQYNYYLSRYNRHDIQKNRANAVKVLVESIKQSIGRGDEKYKPSKLAKYDVSLLSEEDIDLLVAGKRRCKGLSVIKPYARAYGNNPTVKTALKMYHVMLCVIFSFLTISLLAEFSGNEYMLIPLFMLFLAVCFAFFWHISYYTSLLIAKLRIKNKLLIAIAIVVISFIELFIINVIGGIFS